MVVLNKVKEGVSCVANRELLDENQNLIFDEANALKEGLIAFCFTEEQVEAVKDLFIEGIEFMVKKCDGYFAILPKKVSTRVKHEFEALA